MMTIIESENELAESTPLENIDGDEDEEENGEEKMDNFENSRNDKNRMEIKYKNLDIYLWSKQERA